MYRSQGKPDIMFTIQKMLTQRYTELSVHRLALYKKKPSYMGQKLWNKLQQDLKKKSGRAFKVKLKR